MRPTTVVSMSVLAALLSTCSPVAPPPCTADAECGPARVCLPTQLCAPSCVADSQCSATERCSTGGGCVARMGCGADGDCGAAEVCGKLTQACVARCDVSGCKTGETCSATGHCLGPTSPAVDAGSASCGGELFEATKVQANFLIVLDHSGSMADFAGTESKWNSATGAVRTLTTRHDQEIRFGLQLFSNHAVRCDPGHINVPVGDARASQISSALPTDADGNMTPLGAALHVAGGAPELVDATRANNILLITDGMENCGGSPVGEVRSIFGRDIKTYVVGFGSEVDRNMLSQMATVGGTARAGTQKYYQADDPAELARAMTAIAQGAAGCDVKLAKTPPDPSKIYVYVNGVQQPADPNRVNGWSYQASTDRVTLYGASCEKVSQNPGAKINIVYGCPDDSFVEGGNGSPCASNGQCASNRCVNGTCQGGAGGPGGSPCTAPNDCQSLACTNGVCEGPKPDGTPCTQNTQCLSGQCLSGGVCGSDIN